MAQGGTGQASTRRRREQLRMLPTALGTRTTEPWGWVELQGDVVSTADLALQVM